MKTQSLTVMAIMFALFHVKAQNHVTEKVNLTASLWTQYNPESPTQVSCFGTFNEDTTLSDGITYLKLFSSNTDHVSSQSSFAGGIRYDSTSNRVYYRSASASEAVILYDFNLRVNDTLKADNGYHVIKYPGDTSPFSVVTVKAIDSVKTSDSIWRKTYDLGWGNTIIEGVGNVGRTFFAVLNLFTTGHDPVFGCYKNAGECIYARENCDKCFGSYVGMMEWNKQHDAQLVYPNPVNEHLYIKEMETDHAHLAIYNLNGQLVLSADAPAFSQASPVNVSSLVKGVYYYVLTSSSGHSYKNKLIKL